MSQATQTLQAMTKIAIEREKLITETGFDSLHDDQQLQSELVMAASSYALHAIASDEERARFEAAAPPAWPLEAAHWQPGERKQDLVRAAALLVAEIERLNRLKPESVEAQLKAAEAPVNTFGSGPLPIGLRPQ